MLMEGLRSNSTLTTLNLSANSVGLTTAETLSGIFLENTVPLAALDLSVNNFDERCAEVRDLSARWQGGLELPSRTMCVTCMDSGFVWGCADAVELGVIEHEPYDTRPAREREFGVGLARGCCHPTRCA